LEILCPHEGAVMNRVSADWRFLESVPRDGRALIIGVYAPDLDSALETSVVGPDDLEGVSGVFDLVVVGSPPTTQLLRSVASVTDPVRGLVMVGIGRPDHHRSLGIPSGPRVRSLSRRAGRVGLSVEQVFAALPNPWNPEYMFARERGPTTFAASHFLLSRRPEAWTTRHAVATHWWWRFAAFASPGAMALMRVGDTP
jgi:hypothetical protein